MLNKCHFSNIKAVPHNPGNGISVVFDKSAQFKSSNLLQSQSYFEEKDAKSHFGIVISDHYLWQNCSEPLLFLGLCVFLSLCLFLSSFTSFWQCYSLHLR